MMTTGKIKAKVPPRVVPDRDSKYMGLALVYAGLSKDPHTQMGAFIVAEDNRPLGFGYNGPPAIIDDNEMNWDRPDKYDLISHAEVNAIEYSNGDLENATIYVTGLPCRACMLDIVRKKIARVVYLNRNYDKNSMQSDQSNINRVHEIARVGNVKLEEFKGNANWLLDWNLELRNLGILGNCNK